MGFDVKTIKGTLAKANAPTKKTYEVDKRIWKPRPGINTLRILQSVNNPDNPFVPVDMYHFMMGQSKPALTNWNEKDPVVIKAQELKKQGNAISFNENNPDPDKGKILYFTACDLMGGKDALQRGHAVTSHNCQVIDRDVDTDEIKMWTLTNAMLDQIVEEGEELEKNLVAYDPNFNEGDSADVTDAENGYDIIVEYIPTNNKNIKEKYPEYKGPFSDTKYPQYKMSFAKKPSVLTTNEELANKIINHPLDVYDIYPKPTYEELEANLESFLEWKMGQIQQLTTDKEVVYKSPNKTETKETPSVAEEQKPKTDAKGVEDFKALFD